MIKKSIGRKHLLIYDSVSELPSNRYHLFNSYCLMSMGIGSDVEGINEHIADIFGALQKKDFDRLNILFQNYYHSLRMIVDHEDIPSVAFACLVHSVNGKEVIDTSEEGLKRLAKDLAGAKRRVIIVNMFNELKKKSRTITRHIFRKGQLALGVCLCSTVI